MIKYIVIFAIIIMSVRSAYGQRYLPAMRGVEVMGGIIETTKGFHVQAGFSKYTFKKNRWFANASYLQRNYGAQTGTVPASQFAAGGGYYLRLVWDYTQSAVLSVGAAGLLGYETVNWNAKTLANGAQITNGDSFIYGFEACLEFEYYIDDRYALLASVKQRGCGGSSVRMFHTLFGIGIKYILD